MDISFNRTMSQKTMVYILIRLVRVIGMKNAEYTYKITKGTLKI